MFEILASLHWFDLDFFEFMMSHQHSIFLLYSITVFNKLKYLILYYEKRIYDKLFCPALG